MKEMIAVALLLGLAAAQAGSQEAAPAKEKPAASPASPPMSIAGPSYVIGADDVLLVSVWKEPDLTMTLPVRPDGNISLPLLNDVTAAGLSPTQLAASISEKLKKYVADPRVTVIVTQINSQKVYVTGEVLHTKGIYVLRDASGQQQKIRVNYKRLVKGQAIDQNILLKPGDTIVVP
jgi:polysaccharide export outer membrane protein